MATSAWQVAAPLVAELRPDILKRVLLLYARYDLLNRSVDLYAEAVNELHTIPKDSPRAAKLRDFTNSLVDVFQTTCDTAVDGAKALLPALIDLAKIPKKLRIEPPDDYEARVKQLMRERGERMNALAAMDDDPPPSTKC